MNRKIKAMEIPPPSPPRSSQQNEPASTPPQQSGIAIQETNNYGVKSISGVRVNYFCLLTFYHHHYFDNKNTGVKSSFANE